MTIDHPSSRQQQATASTTERTIVICVTFREFDGSSNAKIQELLLDSLERQSYKNFILSVTNYRENIDRLREVLSRYSFEYHVDQSPKDYVLSFTQTLQSGIKYLERGRSILLFTCADHIFPEDFLQTLVDHFEPGCAGIFHPSIVYTTVNDFQIDRPIWDPQATPGIQGRIAFPPSDPMLDDWLHMDPGRWDVDLTFADGDLMLDAAHQARLEKFRIDGYYPGYVHSVLVTYYSPKELRKNLFFKSRFAAIQNVYGISQEDDAQRTYKEVRGEALKNEGLEHDVYELEEVMKNFTRDFGVEAVEFSERLYCRFRHLARFTVVGSEREQDLYQMYLGFWEAQHRVRYEHLGPAGQAVLHRMKQLLHKSFEDLAREQETQSGTSRIARAS